MTIRISRKSTPMDQQGRIFLPRDIRKAMRLPPAATVEFVIEGDGSVTLRKADNAKR